MRHFMPLQHIRFLSFVLAMVFLSACVPGTQKNAVSGPAPEKAAIAEISVPEESESSAVPEDPAPAVTESPEQSYEPSPEPSPVPEETEPEERGDLIDTEGPLPDPESHYVFRPKVSSAYLEEVFGKTMCETWFNLVDAILAGEDTFAQMRAVMDSMILLIEEAYMQMGMAAPDFSLVYAMLPDLTVLCILGPAMGFGFLDVLVAYGLCKKWTKQSLRPMAKLPYWQLPRSFFFQDDC